MLAAAFSLWSCKLSDGTSCGREYADRMLWERTSHSLSDVGDVCRHTALAGILYGIGDEAERRLVADRCCHGATVEIGANAVSIEYRGSRGRRERAGYRRMEGALSRFMRFGVRPYAIARWGRHRHPLR